MYQGHCTDGSSVQKHSAGGLYPYIIFAKQCGDVLRYGVIKPTGDDVLLTTHESAVDFALRCKHGSAQKRINR